MSTSTSTTTDGFPNTVKVIFWIVVFAAIYWTFFHRDKPPRLEDLVAKNHATLNEIVNRENTYSPMTNLYKGKAVFSAAQQRFLTVVGDGIAGVAVAKNSPIKDVRLFGSRSYWEELHGVPEVWQSTTSLDEVFKAAKFTEPSTNDGQQAGKNPTRLLWIAVERSRLLALKEILENNESFHYARNGRSRLSFMNNKWEVSDALGNQLQTDGPIILATGIAKPRTIVEILGNTSDDKARLYKTRHDMVIDKKIIGSDDYFAIPAPLDDLKTIGILGAGGAAWDVALHAIESGNAAKVVVFGAENPSNSTTGLYGNSAFKKLQEKHGSKICTVAGTISDVKYEAGGVLRIVVTRGNNGSESYGDNGSSCSTLETSPKQLQIDRLDKLLEALGRDEGGIAEILEPLATQLGELSYQICKKGNKWIGARVAFTSRSGEDKNKPPNNVYLVGAMAASALKIGPTSPVWTSLVSEFSADRNLQSEHPPHGFAGAAYTGSQLVQCFKRNGDWDNSCKCALPTSGDLIPIPFH